MRCGAWEALLQAATACVAVCCRIKHQLCRPLPLVSLLLLLLLLLLLPPSPATVPLLQDLKAAFPDLARGLQQLLDFEGDVEAVFCRK